MKRFRFDGVDLVENATGRWVRHEDHTARIAELEAERDRLRDRRDYLIGEILRLREGLDTWDAATLRLKVLEITRDALAGSKDA